MSTNLLFVCVLTLGALAGCISSSEIPESQGTDGAPTVTEAPRENIHRSPKKDCLHRSDEPDGSPDRSLGYSGIISTGQSVAMGMAPALTTEQPYGNLMPEGGTEQWNFTSLVPLVENGSETPSSSIANSLHEHTGKDYVVTLSALSGAALSSIEKGTDPYERALGQVEQVTEILGPEYYHVDLITLIHGESDAVLLTADYDRSVARLQKDYEADLQHITCQTTPVPLYLNQMSSWSHYGLNESDIPLQQLAASRDYPHVYLVAPTYPYVFEDGTHLTAESSRLLGYQFGKAAATPDWSPLQPVDVDREGTNITIRFGVPHPPLVLDTRHVDDPGQFGFEFHDESEYTPEISDVRLEGEDRLIITLDSEPAGPGKEIRYAYTGIAGQGAGPFTGPRGNLRDSDPTTTATGEALWNWAVHFAEPVD